MLQDHLDSHQSALQVAATLSSLGVKHTLEALTADGLFSVDIGIQDGPDGALSVAIEVDGPHHFTVNGCNPLGASPAGQWIIRGALTVEERSVSMSLRSIRFLCTQLLQHSGRTYVGRQIISPSGGNHVG